MLDFYLIKANKIKPEYPEQKNLEFVGGIDMKQFKILADKGIIEDIYNYYSDFRWDKITIEIMINKLNQNTDTCLEFEKFKSILKKAINTENEIIAYCD